MLESCIEAYRHSLVGNPLIVSYQGECYHTGNITEHTLVDQTNWRRQWLLCIRDYHGLICSIFDLTYSEFVVNITLNDNWYNWLGWCNYMSLAVVIIACRLWNGLSPFRRQIIVLTCYYLSSSLPILLRVIEIWHLCNTRLNMSVTYGHVWPTASIAQTCAIACERDTSEV